MATNDSKTLLKLDEFISKLDEIDQYETDSLTPVVLELTGKLGTLNRMAMHLMQAAITEGSELQTQQATNPDNTGDDLERLKLKMRETSERVECALSRLKGKLTLVNGSINISCDILNYISQVRKLLTESIWE